MPNCDAAWLRYWWLCCCSCTCFPICSNLGPVFWLCISVEFSIFLFSAPRNYYLWSICPVGRVLRKWVYLVTEKAASKLITLIIVWRFSSPLMFFNHCLSQPVCPLMIIIIVIIIADWYCTVLFPCHGAFSLGNKLMWSQSINYVIWVSLCPPPNYFVEILWKV